MFNRPPHGSEVLSRKEDDFAPEKKTNALGDLFIPMWKKEEMAAEKWERSVAVDEALQYVIYVYLNLVNSALANIAQYMEHNK